MVTITVHDVERYIGRKGLKKPNWFRCDIEMVLGHELFGLTASQKFLWMVVLALGTQKYNEGAAFTVDIGYFVHLLGISDNEVLDGLKELEKKGFIDVEVPQEKIEAPQDNKSSHKATQDHEHECSQHDQEVTESEHTRTHMNTYVHERSRDEHICALRDETRRDETNQELRSFGQPLGPESVGPTTPKESSPPGHTSEGESPSKKPSKSERGAIAEFSDDEVLVEMLGEVTTRVQRKWIKVYNDPEYIRTEIIKASTWLDNNPHKGPKSSRGVSQFLTNWLSRGWDRYRKTLPSRRPDQPRRDNSFLLGETEGGH